MFTAVALCCTSLPAGAAGERPSFGLIRWDAWFAGSERVGLLFRYGDTSREPFFLRPGEGAVFGGQGDVAVARAEALHAWAAGFDYWIFGYHHETDCSGRPIQWSIDVNSALRAYRAAEPDTGLRFALDVVYACYKAQWDRFVADIIPLVRDGRYMRTPDNRPLLFFFVPDLARWTAEFGDAAGAKSRMTALASAVEASIGSRPLLVALNFTPAGGSEAVRSLGIDPNASYGFPLGNEGRSVPSTEFISLQKRYWLQAEALGIPYLLPVSVGWDYAPELTLAGTRRNPNGNRAILDAPEVQSLFSRAVEATRSGTSIVQSLGVVYAWNEFSEGGWLAPDRRAGVAKLAAVSAVLGARSLPAFTLRATPASDACTASGPDLSACSIHRPVSEALPCPVGMVAGDRPLSSDELMVCRPR